MRQQLPLTLKCTLLEKVEARKLLHPMATKSMAAFGNLPKEERRAVFAVPISLRSISKHGHSTVSSYCTSVPCVVRGHRLELLGISDMKHMVDDDVHY